jgi:hypothetical protein
MIDSLRHKKAQAHIEREEYVPAWLMLSEMLNEQPDDPKSLYLAGCVLRGQGHTGMALQLFRRALAFASNIPNVWMHFGACLHDTNQYDEARDSFKVVLKALPDDPMPPANIAAGYVQQGNAQLALKWADRALALDPQCRIARVAAGFGNLALGQWAKGWEYSDSLYGETLRIRVYRDPEEPQWDGTKGQTVIVQADQGLGEMLMFSQMLPEMAKDCKKLVVETNPRLLNLFKRNFPEVDVYGTLKERSDLDWPLKYDIDAHMHISAIGRFYRTKDEDFPRKAYLTADPEKRAKWRAWLEQFPKPWVGLAWRGGIARTNEATRSLALAQFKPIMEQGGTFISLAYQDVGLEIARWNIDNREQVHVPDINNEGDFDEWVALIAELDHTVSVLTTAVHVCGALGKRCHVLVPSVCQWQHAYGGDGMVWYPPSTVRNYRQREGESWSRVITEIAGDYQAFVMPLAA